MSPEFRRALERAVSHYGVAGLNPLPCWSRRYSASSLPGSATTPACPRSARCSRRGSPAPADESRDLLDRLVRALQPRAPLAADIARSVAFRWFRRPEAQAARAAALAGVPRGTARARRPGRRARARPPHRRPARNPPSARRLPGRAGLRARGRRGSRCWRSSPAGTTACRTCDASRVRLAGRPFVACDYRLEIQPDRASATTAIVTAGRFDEVVAGGRVPAGLRAR